MSQQEQQYREAQSTGNANDTSTQLDTNHFLFCHSGVAFFGFMPYQLPSNRHGMIDLLGKLACLQQKFVQQTNGRQVREAPQLYKMVWNNGQEEVTLVDDSTYSQYSLLDGSDTISTTNTDSAMDTTTQSNTQSHSQSKRRKDPPQTDDWQRPKRFKKTQQ